MLTDKSAFLQRLLAFFGVSNDRGVPMPEIVRIVEADGRNHHLGRGRADEWRRVFPPRLQEISWRIMRAELHEGFGWRA